MPSQTALQSESKTQIAQAENRNKLIVEAGKLSDRINELYRRIERRAYEFFEERGYEIGYDTEDWFRAESEYLMKIPVEINEDDTTIVARAQMPGFDEKEITINIEPHNLFIAARTERSFEEKIDEFSVSERDSKEVFTSIALPCEVEADQAKAIYKDGLLEISVPKSVASEKQSAEGNRE